MSLGILGTTSALLFDRMEMLVVAYVQTRRR